MRLCVCHEWLVSLTLTCGTALHLRAATGVSRMSARRGASACSRDMCDARTRTAPSQASLTIVVVVAVAAEAEAVAVHVAALAEAVAVSLA